MLLTLSLDVFDNFVVVFGRWKIGIWLYQEGKVGISWQRPPSYCVTVHKQLHISMQK
jgi:hypothetical protein